MSIAYRYRLTAGNNRLPCLLLRTHLELRNLLRTSNAEPAPKTCHHEPPTAVFLRRLFLKFFSRSTVSGTCAYVLREANQHRRIIHIQCPSSLFTPETQALWSRSTTDGSGMRAISSCDNSKQQQQKYTHNWRKRHRGGHTRTSRWSQHHNRSTCLSSSGETNGTALLRCSF